jgi:hypothetical protein
LHQSGRVLTVSRPFGAHRVHKGPVKVVYSQIRPVAQERSRQFAAHIAKPDEPYFHIFIQFVV